MAIVEVKEALSLSSGYQKPLGLVFHNPEWSATTPPVPFHTPGPNTVTKGFVDILSTTANLESQHPFEPANSTLTQMESALPNSSTYPPVPYLSLAASPCPMTTTPNPIPPQAVASVAPMTATAVTSANSHCMLTELLARKRVADSYLERQPQKKARKE
jgi:hypothetical protein